MKVYGIDFTSAPSNRKPITYADCTLENESCNLQSAFKSLKTTKSLRSINSIKIKSSHYKQATNAFSISKVDEDMYIIRQDLFRKQYPEKPLLFDIAMGY